MDPLILVVDDEPDVEVLFRQQFRRDLRTGRFTMEFAPSAPAALERISNAGNALLILIRSCAWMNVNWAFRTQLQAHASLSTLMGEPSEAFS